MKAPGFWARPMAAPGALARLLSPLGWIYGAATARRVARRATAAPIPVVCVGNLTAGGTGKTPVAIAVARALSDLGATPHFVSRGYGGSVAGPHRVAMTDPAARVGDEPLLLAAYAPAWVARDRAAGVAAAAAAGATVAVLDDGFQNPAPPKDLSLIVVDAASGFGNGRMIPAGPLREPVRAGLGRADAVVALGAEDARARLLADWPVLSQRPVLGGDIRPKPIGRDWWGLRVMAFAGIGRPEKFFATLRDLGADVVATRAFGDHEAYPPPILRRLRREAAEMGAELVTTEKDAARLPPSMRGVATPLPVEVVWTDPDALRDLLKPLSA